MGPSLGGDQAVTPGNEMHYQNNSPKIGNYDIFQLEPKHTQNIKTWYLKHDLS
jgi:hypothetical protein